MSAVKIIGSVLLGLIAMNNGIDSERSLLQDVEEQPQQHERSLLWGGTWSKWNTDSKSDKGSKGSKGKKVSKSKSTWSSTWSKWSKWSTWGDKDGKGTKSSKSDGKRWDSDSTGSKGSKDSKGTKTSKKSKGSKRDKSSKSDGTTWGTDSKSDKSSKGKKSSKSSKSDGSTWGDDNKGSKRSKGSKSDKSSKGSKTGGSTWKKNKWSKWSKWNKWNKWSTKDDKSSKGSKGSESGWKTDSKGSKGSKNSKSSSWRLDSGSKSSKSSGTGWHATKSSKSSKSSKSDWTSPWVPSPTMSPVDCFEYVSINVVSVSNCDGLDYGFLSQIEGYYYLNCDCSTGVDCDCYQTDDHHDLPIWMSENNGDRFYAKLKANYYKKLVLRAKSYNSDGEEMNNIRFVHKGDIHDAFDGESKWKIKSEDNICGNWYGYITLELNWNDCHGYGFDCDSSNGNPFCCY